MEYFRNVGLPGLKARRSTSMRNLGGPASAKSLEFLYQNYKDQIVLDLIKTFESRITKFQEETTRTPL